MQTVKFFYDTPIRRDGVLTGHGLEKCVLTLNVVF